jgi:SAM-dependent methyltransferase
MVDIYNTRAQAAVAELYPSKINAVVGDLFSKSDPNPASLSGPEYHDFDLATVGFGFHHFEDVVHASRCLKERLRSGGVLLFSDFLQGGDLLVGEDGKPVEGSEGDHMVHHHHGHSHGHDHGHDHGHQEQHHDSHHGGHHHTSAAEQTSASPATNEINNDSTKDLSTMNASIVVPSFTIDGVKEFLTEAGFVDVDIMVMEQKAYMEFGGKKMYRTVFFARGRRPLE